MNQRSRLVLIIRGVAAGLILTAMPIIIPVALWRFVGWPLPTELPSWEQFFTHLTDQSIPDLVLFKSLALLCWIAWLQFGFALMAEGWALAHGRSASRVPLVATMQFAVASLVGSLTLALALLRGQIPSTPVVSISAFASTTTEGTHPQTAQLPVIESLHEPTAPSPAEVPEPLQQATYIVQPKDCLWTIAAKLLGDPNRFTEIWKLNAGKQFTDTWGRTRAFLDPNLIHPGWKLDLPLTVAAPAGHQTAPIENADQEDSAAIAVPSLADESIPMPLAPTQAIRPATDSSRASDDGQREESGADWLRTAVVGLASSAAVSAFLAFLILKAQRLRARHRRRWRRISDPGFGMNVERESQVVTDLRRSLVSPLGSDLESALAEVVGTWMSQTGSWPRILSAVHNSDQAAFFIESTTKNESQETRVRFTAVPGGTWAQAQAPFATLNKARTPLENGLLVSLGATSEGEAVQLGLLATGNLAVVGPDAARFATHCIVSCCAGSPDTEILLLGSADTWGKVRNLPYVIGMADWKDPQPLDALQGNLLNRARTLMEAETPDIWTQLATDQLGLPALLVVATEPPAELLPAVDAIQQLQEQGGVFIALDWVPSTARVKVEVGKTVAISGSPGLPKSLWPLMFADSQLSEILDCLTESHEEHWEEIDSISPAVQDLTQDNLLPAPTNNGDRPASSIQIDDTRESVPAPDNGLVSASPPLPVLPPDIAVIIEPAADLPAVYCLGTTRVSRNGRPMLKGWRGHAFELLMYLLANPEGVSNDRLIEDLLPRLDLPKARAELDRRVSQVRVKLRRGSQDPLRYVMRNAGTVRLEKEAIWSDLDAFQSLITLAERSTDEQAIAYLQAAVDLYRGDFCDNHYFDWVEPHRIRWRERFIYASARLAKLLQKSDGRLDEALLVVDRAIAADPLCEDLQRVALELEGELGRFPKAEKRFQDYSALLNEELGAYPEQKTQELMRHLEKKAGLRQLQ